MKTILALAATAVLTFTAAAQSPQSLSFSIDEWSHNVTATLERGKLGSEQTMLGIATENQYTIIDANCLAELEGVHDTGSELYASVGEDMVKLIGDLSFEMHYATPEITVECGPFDDCLPCPQNIEGYQQAYDETNELGVREFPNGVFPEGCGGGDGPGGRAPAMCAITDSPCAVTCTAISEQ